jgi:glycosyltransferase involved in cell wall biosynthesis
VKCNTDNLNFGVIGAWKRDENYYGLKNFVNGINNNKINLVICGSNIERLSLINFKNINVNLLGFVDDLDSFFNSIDLLIIPLEKGAGVKIKVLQSLIYGVPCIGTKVAFEGIDLNPNCIEFNDIRELISFINHE